MPSENILGDYECRDCGNAFMITATGKTAYDGWMPTCPECGRDDDVVQVGRVGE